MKTLGSFIDRKKLATQAGIDEKSVFYIFQIVIKEEYGRQGAENVKPVFFKDRRIFVRISGPNWPSEIWLNKKLIIAKMNKELGGEEIVDLVGAD